MTVRSKEWFVSGIKAQAALKGDTLWDPFIEAARVYDPTIVPFMEECNRTLKALRDECRKRVEKKGE